MADEITLEDLRKKQEEMVAIIALLEGETDTDKIQATAAALQREGEELAAMGRAFEEQQLAKHGPPKRGGTEVVLTEPQRARIEAATGVKMESIHFRDDQGIMTQTMPFTDPRIVEYKALQEAKRRKQAEEADAQLDAELEKTVAEIEAASPAASEKLAELKQDPNFMGGKLAKK